MGYIEGSEWYEFGTVCGFFPSLFLAPLIAKYANLRDYFQAENKQSKMSSSFSDTAILNIKTHSCGVSEGQFAKWAFLCCGSET